MTETKPNSIVPKECRGWEVAGVMHPILEHARRAAIAALFDKTDMSNIEFVCNTLLGHRDEVLAILSLEAPKQRKTRRDKGHPRTRKIAPLPQTKKQAAINAALQDGKQ